MTNQNQAEINGNKLTPRELTFTEVDLVLNSLLEPKVHPIEMVCPEEPVAALAIALSCGVEIDELNELTPSAAKQLIGEVKQSNPFLCQAIENLAKIAMEAQKVQGQALTNESTTSEEQPA